MTVGEGSLDRGKGCADAERVAMLSASSTARSRSALGLVFYDRVICSQMRASE